MSLQIPIDQAELKAFCQKWKITELSLFGSVLRDDFGPDSDVDVLVTFEADAPWRFRDLLLMEEELKAIFHRDVDLIERAAVIESRNHIRRKHILSTARALYVA